MWVKYKNRIKHIKEMNLAKLLIISLFATFSLSAAGQVKLTVEVSNIKSTKGVIKVGVYNQENGCFEEKNSFKGVNSPAQKGVMNFTFEIPEGEYVVAVIHDENGNGLLDKNFLGIPKEPYGFSGTATRPVYQDAVFPLKESKKITIRLN